MKTSVIGRELIKGFEGLRNEAYLCPAGVPTIGYGTTKYPDGSKVKIGDKCTKAEADAYLRCDLGKFEKAVTDLVATPLTQSQFDALVSFVYNVGVSALTNSTLLSKLNQKDYTSAAEEFLKWNKAGGKVVAGLTNRRAAERALFLK